MRIATILIAAILSLVVLAGPVVAHHRDGHDGGPPSGTQHANKENKGKGQSGANRFGATNAQECADNVRNHGQYVSCITSLVRAAPSDVKAEGLGLDSDCDNAESLIACAAHSDVGKPKKG